MVESSRNYLSNVTQFAFLLILVCCTFHLFFQLKLLLFILIALPHILIAFIHTFLSPIFNTQLNR